mgnify:CR=1 FL=1
MGQEQPLTKEILRKHLSKKITIDDFIFLYVIGRGNYGKVWKVKHKLTGRYYALKQMTKAKIIAENSEMSILRERVFLAQMKSPFVIKMFLSFTNKYNLFLLMELLSGGDLRYHLSNYTFAFNESQLKFILSNIILGLEYIHSRGIVHRDLKPENLMFDELGYIKITDFGVSCYKDKLNTQDDSGTPAYTAPETLKMEKQDYSVDYYSLGVIAYEFVKRKLPYDSDDRTKIKKMMKNDTIDLKKDESLKNKYTEVFLDFITKLLNKNPEERLGSKYGEKEIKHHMFFTDLNWDLITKRKYNSPLYQILRYSKLKRGNTKELFDYDYCSQIDELPSSTADLYAKIIAQNGYSQYFKYFNIICEENIIRDFNEHRNELIKANKKLIRSWSTKEIGTDILKQNINNFNFPFNNNNPIELLLQIRENKLKQYYEEKIFKYRNRLNKLKKLLNEKSVFHLKNPNQNLNNSKKEFPKVNSVDQISTFDKTTESSYLPMINRNNNNSFMNKITNKYDEYEDNFFDTNQFLKENKVYDYNISDKIDDFDFNLESFSINPDSELSKYKYYNTPYEKSLYRSLDYDL